MNKIKPLKRFGQNFLQDQNILRKIVDEIDPKEEDLMLEIGPGHGSLTEKILERNKNLVAVEIDKRVTEELGNRYPSLKIIQADFLKINLNEFNASDNNKLRVFGNIPYYITSPILFKLFENNLLIQDAVFMVQLEVAKRITAKMDSEDYGILSVLINYFGEAKLAFKVSPNVFYPKPKVFSAVVHIYFNKSRKDQNFNKVFTLIVKSAFGNRRKTLKNSLSNGIFAAIDFSKSGVDLSLRAEKLEVNDFIKLTDFAIKNKNHLNP